MSHWFIQTTQSIINTSKDTPWALSTGFKASPMLKKSRDLCFLSFFLLCYPKLKKKNLEFFFLKFFWVNLTTFFCEANLESFLEISIFLVFFSVLYFYRNLKIFYKISRAFSLETKTIDNCCDRTLLRPGWCLHFSGVVKSLGVLCAKSSRKSPVWEVGLTTLGLENGLHLCSSGPRTACWYRSRTSRVLMQSSEYHPPMIQLGVSRLLSTASA